MKLGIITNKYTAEEFQNIKNKGLDFAEFCINYNGANPNSHMDFLNKIDEIKQHIDSVNLPIASIGRWGGFKILKGNSTNFQTLEFNLEEIEIDKMLINAAAQFNCPIYVTGCNYIEDSSLFDNYKNTIYYFKDLIEYGKQKNVKIAVYNCRWNNYITSDPAWSAILSNVKELYIKYDPSHCIYSNGDYLHEIAKWGKRFAHVHLKGSLSIDGKRFDDPPAGLDQTNWKKFFSVLYSIGYDGTLSIEPHSNIWQGELGEKGINYTIDYMKNFIL